MDSDDDETFICIGNPVDQPDEDAPLKKPVSIQDLTVKDKRGRPRFHGAFTGGFSAGYFNSVGSKDGFAPAEFVSSRDKKFDSVRQRPEDFMDDEDFGEHGIAPRKLVTSDKFSTEERRKRRYDEGKSLMTGTVFEGSSALTDFILPEKLTIGLKLLKKLGWKQGHGIGSRHTNKEPGQKVYGCSLPTQTPEDSEDEQFEIKDMNPISFKAKDNVHGLDYSGLDPRTALPGTHINLFEPPAITKKGRKGIKGQAFGVGALEDEDEDIYSTDHMSNYDMTMEIEDQSNLHGWTAPRYKQESRHLPIGYVGKVLEGFSLSAKPLNQRKIFPPPDLPRNFRPVHMFLKPRDTEDNGQRKAETAITRGIALGEVGSVFDLVPSNDKEKMDRIRKGKENPDRSLVPTVSEQLGFNKHGTVTGSIHQQQSLGMETESHRTASHGGMSFKPFAKDNRKQARYDRYLNLIKQGNNDAYEEVSEDHMTEWEREREKEEFIKAAKIYKPLSGMIASRFTRAKYEDTEQMVDVPAEEGGDKDDKSKAAKLKMYGKLTRDVFEWHPDRLLCRRFNVPDPYPGSGVVGLPTVKKDKFSVFNFLTFPSTGDTDQRNQSTSYCSTELAKETQTSELAKDIQPAESSKSLDQSSSSSKPVSIFSHLTVPEKQKQSTTRRTEKENPKSIFSHLVENKTYKDLHKSDSLETKETEEKIDLTTDSVEQPREEKPPVDLFAAIFGNTDSEDSDLDEADDQDDKSQTDDLDKGEQLKAEHKTTETIQQQGLEPSKDTEMTKQYLPGGPVAIETLDERLSPELPESSLNYGPHLSTSGSVSSSNSALVSSKHYIQGMGHGSVNPFSYHITTDSTESSHRKHKQSKNKHKKDKKSKHKKSKHKKKEKKKKKYSDSDSSSDDEVPTDKELLQKLKNLPKGKYLL